MVQMGGTLVSKENFEQLASSGLSCHGHGEFGMKRSTPNAPKPKLQSNGVEKLETSRKKRVSREFEDKCSLECCRSGQ